MNLTYSLFLSVKCFFLDRISNVAFIIVWSAFTLTISNGSVFSVSIMFALLTLTICKLHYCFYYTVCTTGTADCTFVMCMVFTVLIFNYISITSIKVKTKYLQLN